MIKRVENERLDIVDEHLLIIDFDIGYILHGDHHKLLRVKLDGTHVDSQVNNLTFRPRDLFVVNVVMTGRIKINVETCR